MKNTCEIYVSAKCCANGDGTKQKPYSTVSKALQSVRDAVKSGEYSTVRVYFLEGEYRAGIELTEEDSGTENCKIEYCRYGNDKVLFINGIHLNKQMFRCLNEQECVGTTDCARSHIRVCSLTEIDSYCASREKFCNAESDVSNKFDCELLCNDKRFNITRYPRKEFLKIEDICDGIDDKSLKHKVLYPKGYTLLTDEESGKRIKEWKNSNDIFLQGYFKWDWADGIAEISSFDITENRIYVKRETGGYGMEKGGKYIFRNVLEELNVPGEYYIDRKNMLLYLYPIEDNIEDVEISVSQKSILKARNVSNITFNGIDFRCTCTDAIDIIGNDCTLKNCTVMGVGGWAIRLKGNGNEVCGCDISHIGRGGISVSGGDIETLTPSGNIVENNYIHDWSEDKWTYCGGVEASGCGNVIKHNEFARSPHYAVFYSGNDNIIEYNYIHDVVQQSNDAGAIYSGRDWSAYGNIIRFNLLENIGNENYFPVGIYWDDCQSGQTAFGNIIVNATGKAFLIGGGRDNIVENNIMLNSEYPMLYDARGIEGVVANGWYKGTQKDGVNWSIMHKAPITDAIWAKRFPTLATVNDNFNDTDDFQFAPNPSYAVIRNNICVCNNDYGFYIAKEVRKLGTVKNNIVYTNVDECIVEGGFYELKPEVKKMLPWFSEIPVDKIGRYKM